MQHHRSPDRAAGRCSVSEWTPARWMRRLHEEGDRVPGPGRHPPRSAGAECEGAEGRIAARPAGSCPRQLDGLQRPSRRRSSTTASGRLPGRGVQPVRDGSGRRRRPARTLHRGPHRGAVESAAHPGCRRRRGAPACTPAGGRACQRRLHRGLGPTTLDGVECLTAHAQTPSQLGLGPALEEATFADEARRMDSSEEHSRRQRASPVKSGRHGEKPGCRRC